MELGLGVSEEAEWGVTGSGCWTGAEELENWGGEGRVDSLTGGKKHDAGREGPGEAGEGGLLCKG